MDTADEHPQENARKPHDEAKRETRPCPQCGHDMIVGQMHGGTSHGRLYWSCTNYPACGHIEPIRTAAEQALYDALVRQYGGIKPGNKRPGR